jgi:pimeloyl-ACP methyl ester carboxylesterase
MTIGITGLNWPINNVIIVAPAFSDEYYPRSLAYNLGNMYDLEDNPLPEEVWSFSIIEPIFDFVVDQINGNQTSYDMFGHSAGAQFAQRFVLFKNDSNVNRVVLANAGWYTMLDFLIDYPYGLKETSLNIDKRTPILQHKIVILLGDGDTERTRSLRQTPEADLQGRNRYERGLFYFEMANQLALENDVNLGWIQQTVPGVGHNNAEMVKAAAQFLYGIDH